MFRCPMCSLVSAPGTPAHRITVQIRSKKYPYRATANVLYRKKPEPKNGSKKVVLPDPGGTGTEITREVQVCAACAKKAAPPPVAATLF